MTSELLVRRIRALTGTVDITASDLTDVEIMEAVQDAVAVLESRGVLGAGTYAVGTDQTDDATFGVLPEPTLIDGNLIATRVAIDLLRATYRGRLDRGELGISWTSGLEAESSISAEKAYKAGIQDLEDELRELTAIRLSGVTGARTQ